MIDLNEVVIQQATVKDCLDKVFSDDPKCALAVKTQEGYLVLEMINTVRVPMSEARKYLKDCNV